MPPRDTRVIGYFAYLSPMQVVCTDVDACVVSGSSKAMEEYLTETDPRRAAGATVRKTRSVSGGRREHRRPLHVLVAHLAQVEPLDGGDEAGKGLVE